MPSKRLIAALSSIALVAAGPALAQSDAVKGSRAAAALSPSNALGDDPDSVGWAMAAVVGAGVLYVLFSILLDDDDDDEDDDFSPVSP